MLVNSLYPLCDLLVFTLLIVFTSVNYGSCSIIDDYSNIANQIIETLTSTNGSSYGQAYNRLAIFTDTIGNRVSGSESLEHAIDYVLEALIQDGLENVHGEEVTVPHWVRGNERLTMLEPRVYEMNFLSLGTSVGTRSEGITAQAIVVSSFDELEQKKSEVEGKIVVFNQYCDWELEPVGCYSATVQYRTQGAATAAKYGAVATLTRSVAAFSIASPHTGVTDYSEDAPKIPAACITIEDAEAMARMQHRGQNITLHLYMEAQNLPDTTSYNVVAEWTGTQYPDEVVIVSGHIDSWDVGVGAMDDGGGAFISWQVLSTLKQLNLRAKRTIRLVMWTCEEFGGIGAEQYYQAHQNETDKISLAMENDIGAFTPLGIAFTGNEDATAIMQEIMPLLAPINATTLSPDGAETDTSYFAHAGVPVASLVVENEKYFWFHHSKGDQMTVLDSDQLNLAAALYTVVAYVVADLDELLPRN